MKKLIVLIAITFAILNVNAQTTDNFCDPELKSKIEEVSKMGGTFLKEYLTSSQELKWDIKTKKYCKSFPLLLSKNTVYRFYLLSSIKTPCETMLTLTDENDKQLKVINQKSGDPVAYVDVEIIKTGPYHIVVSFKDNTKGCAMVFVNFMSTKSSTIQTEKVDTSIVYTEVEVNARFNDGDLNNFRNYIAKNFKVDTNLLKGVTGNIFIEFVVNTKGKVEKAKILRSSGVSYFDKQAIEVVKSSTGWTPAILKGVAVKQSFVLPIKFK